MSEVKVGDRVLSTNTEDGTLIFSEVVAFLDRDPHRMASFYTIETASGKSVTLTSKHLLYYFSQKDVEDSTIVGNVRDKVLNQNTIVSKYNCTRIQKNLVIDSGCNNSFPLISSMSKIRSGRLERRNYVTQQHKEKIPHGRLAYAEELSVGQYLLLASPDISPSDVSHKAFVSISREYKKESSSNAKNLASVFDNVYGEKVNPFPEMKNSEKHLSPDRIVSIVTKTRRGVFAPLTVHGTVIVDGFAISCYAFLKDVNLAHNVLAPIRAYHFTRQKLSDWLNSVTVPVSDLLASWPYLASLKTKWYAVDQMNFTSHSEVYTTEQIGAHWYAKVLYSIAVDVLGMDIFIFI
ncbi:hedgehog protein [Plakobranchus ocellatus]|uniref:Hedgehog protein n=1 Tax=Plakobranchus ocellatus TaxID=259542 RepID=A0AAV3YZL1_9GAST|nr:hedgehog protein [Plakobranchus ocellatus]